MARRVIDHTPPVFTRTELITFPSGSQWYAEKPYTGPLTPAILRETIRKMMGMLHKVNAHKTAPRSLCDHHRHCFRRYVDGIANTYDRDTADRLESAARRLYRERMR